MSIRAVITGGYGSWGTIPDVIRDGFGAAPYVPTISITLTDASNAVLASLSGLSWAWWDDPDLATQVAPTVQGSGASTDGSGVFSVTTLTGSGLTAAGQVGWITISDSDGDPANNATYSVAAGPVEVS